MEQRGWVSGQQSLWRRNVYRFSERKVAREFWKLITIKTGPKFEKTTSREQTSLNNQCLI